MANSILSFAQKEDLSAYIPYKNTSLLTHPVVILKVKLYLVYKFENDKQNYTLDSLSLLKEQFGWINGFYKDLSPPTLPAQDGNKYFIPDSRIRFRLDEVQTIVDSSAWDRIFITKDKNKVKIDSTRGSEIYLANKYFFRVRNVDSISINNKNYTVLSKKKGTKATIVKLNKKVIDAQEYFYAYKKKDLNCDRYIWEKYANKDQNYIHVFCTGSSLSNVAFGCGPAPYFLNISNLIKGGGWGNAQLIAHELGHTIGLNHTNYPQFDDLPKKDKFGFIPCDSLQTSNNIMGYNQCRRYLSPKQIGFVHKKYTVEEDRIRLTTANEYDATQTHVIWYDTVWNKAMIIKGDVVVKKRQTLTINENVHLAEGATIYLEKKAKLILNNAVLTNHFETKWNGIVKCKSVFRSKKNVKKKKNSATVELNNSAAINNTK